MSHGAISGDYGHSGSSSVNYGHKYTPKKSGSHEINIFGNNNSNQLRKLIEHNGSIFAPEVSNAAIRH